MTQDKNEKGHKLATVSHVLCSPYCACTIKPATLWSDVYFTIHKSEINSRLWLAVVNELP